MHAFCAHLRSRVVSTHKADFLCGKRERTLHGTHSDYPLPDTPWGETVFWILMVRLKSPISNRDWRAIHGIAPTQLRSLNTVSTKVWRSRRFLGVPSEKSRIHKVA